jgi:glycosyltransferase involved in cell wall biosynthesis
MPKPYLVTIHDLSSLFFDDASGLLHAARDLPPAPRPLRADGIIAVSGATQRDVANLVPDVRPTASGSSTTRPTRSSWSMGASRTRGGARCRGARTHRILERYQIRYPFLLYAGSIRPQKNIPRLIEAFAVARSGSKSFRRTAICA